MTGADASLARQLGAWDSRGPSPVSGEWLDAAAEDLVNAGGRYQELHEFQGRI